MIITNIVILYATSGGTVPWILLGVGNSTDACDWPWCSSSYSINFFHKHSAAIRRTLSIRCPILLKRTLSIRCPILLIHNIEAILHKFGHLLVVFILHKVKCPLGGIHKLCHMLKGTEGVDKVWPGGRGDPKFWYYTYKPNWNNSIEKHWTLYIQQLNQYTSNGIQCLLSPIISELLF